MKKKKIAGISNIHKHTHTSIYRSWDEYLLNNTIAGDVEVRLVYVCVCGCQLISPSPPLILAMRMPGAPDDKAIYISPSISGSACVGLISRLALYIRRLINDRDAHAIGTGK